MDLTNRQEPLVRSDNTRLMRELAKPLYEANRWIKLMGVLLIVNGAFYVFSLWGILIAWLPIWMGVLLWKSGKEAEAAQRRGDKAALLESLNKLKTFFTINGIIMVVSLVILGIMMLIFGGSMLAMFGQFKEMQQMMPPGP